MKAKTAKREAKWWLIHTTKNLFYGGRMKPLDHSPVSINKSTDAAASRRNVYTVDRPVHAGVVIYCHLLIAPTDS